MATFSTDRMGILEAWRRAGYTNAEELLGELLQQNDFLRVAAVAPANKGFFNETLRAKELGKGKVTDINGGIPSLASKTDKVSDPVIMFEGQSFVDERLFLGAPDPVAVRHSEDAMNLAGFSLSWNDLLVYGKPQDANGFSGLAARRSKIAGGHVLDMAGSTNLSSCYLIEFGNQGMRLLHAQHGTPGISSMDKGEQKVDAQDGSGKYWAFEMDYRITFGLSVRQDAALWRIANIDITSSTLDSLLPNVIKAKNKLPSKGQRCFLFANSDVKSLIDILVLNSASNVRTVEIENYGPVTMFLSVPVMTMDAITSAETKVS